MNYDDIKKEANAYSGALIVERIIPGHVLSVIEKIFRIITLAFFSLWIAAVIFTSISFIAETFKKLSERADVFYEPFFFALLASAGMWLLLQLLSAFFSSSYFKDSNNILPEFFLKNPSISYSVAKIAVEGFNEPVYDFFASTYGLAVALRLNLNKGEILEYLKSRQKPSGIFSIEPVASETDISLGRFAEDILKYDQSLQKFLATKKIDGSDFIGAALWVEEITSEIKNRRRWWSKDFLGRIPGIGKSWGYGETVLLDRYAGDMGIHPVSISRSAFGKKEAEDVERVLSRGREANVIMVGEEGVSKISVLARIWRDIAAGKILPPLEHKRIYIFDGVAFISAMKEKAPFEDKFLKILDEALKAGNIIFVLDNFEKFYESAKNLGSDILALLDPYLTSPDIQFAAISEVGAWRRYFENNPKVRERFEKIDIQSPGISATLPIIEEEAIKAERKDAVFFTFQAVKAIAESAERYFFEGVMPDKAIDLLLEAVSSAKTARKKIIVEEDILALVSRKTGIAVSDAKSDERTKLLKLEEILHERIVGQDEAVNAIAGALRRARSGISSPNKPLGSFLFLGPTGVGKTETCKALAQVFFGDEKNIIRFDMSEYAANDALSRLIGAMGEERPGIMTSLLREKPYGVLLLDEFEKTSKEVHDLFLQIIDEGFFSDVNGKRVNARNLIIIATSNAGSDIIWKQLQRSGQGSGEVRLDKDEVITEIISRGIFKPELLNRFDGVVLFHPLNSEHLKIISRFQLEKLRKRLKEKGIELIINDPLIEYLVQAGQDPKFGARPMNRAIQEKVEQIIADKILNGEITAGSAVELTSKDLSAMSAEGRITVSV